MESKNTLSLAEITQQLELAEYTQEEIWKILQIFDGDGNRIQQHLNNLDHILAEQEEIGIEEYFVPGALVGSAYLPIDTGGGFLSEEGVNRESGLKNTFEEEVVRFVKMQFPLFSSEQISALLTEKHITISPFNIGTKKKEKDRSPFIDGGIRSLEISGKRVAFFFSDRSDSNYSRVDYVIYPELIKELCRNIKERL